VVRKTQTRLAASCHSIYRFSASVQSRKENGVPRGRSGEERVTSAAGVGWRRCIIAVVHRWSCALCAIVSLFFSLKRDSKSGIGFSVGSPALPYFPPPPTSRKALLNPCCPLFVYVSLLSLPPPSVPPSSILLLLLLLFPLLTCYSSCMCITIIILFVCVSLCEVVIAFKVEQPA
jgi:hypothetical protein